jgi:hypothetical protein
MKTTRNTKQTTWSLAPRTMFIISVLTILGIMSCKKDIGLSDTGHPFDNEASSIEREAGNGQTVIGNQLTNPYKVEIMQQAYNNLYENDISCLAPNYLYVRFLPNSYEDMRVLLESNLELWDFPLDYELETIGERYQDPSVSDPMYTWQYTVVPVNYAFPSVQHEILEQMALVPEDSRLAEEAFRLTNNEFDAPEEYEPDPLLDGCTFVFDLETYKGNAGEPETGAQVLDPGILGGQVPCNCITPDHTRKPSGCVTVRDNLIPAPLDWQGVQEVKVIVARSRFFGIVFNRKDFTDSRGCWEINHRYSGKIHIWVKFESNTCNVKTMEATDDLGGYTFPRRTYIMKKNGPNFNNIEIRFQWSNAIGSKAFRDWAAATMNNSIFDFRQYCNLNQLPSPPGNLKLLLTPIGNGGNTGAAPMIDKWPFIPQFLLTLGAVGIGAVFGILVFPGPGFWVFTGAVLSIAAPDIVLNLSNSGQVNADDVREIMYHELAHSIHYNQVGFDYWWEHIQFIVNNVINGNNPPYGNGNNGPASGRCAVIEMWGFHNGPWAAHLRYGQFHSNGGADPALNTYHATLERAFEINGYIPHAWQFDVIDNNALNPTNNVAERPGIIDFVSGYNRQTIFGTMNANLISPPQQYNLLLNQLPPNQTQQSMQDLRTSYGF